MATTAQSAIAVIGIDIGKNSFHVIGLDGRGAFVLRQMVARPARGPFRQYVCVPDRLGILKAPTAGAWGTWGTREPLLARALPREKLAV